MTDDQFVHLNPIYPNTNMQSVSRVYGCPGSTRLLPPNSGGVSEEKKSLFRKLQGKDRAKDPLAGNIVNGRSFPPHFYHLCIKFVALTQLKQFICCSLVGPWWKPSSICDKNRQRHLNLSVASPPTKRNPAQGASHKMVSMVNRYIKIEGSAQE